MKIVSKHIRNAAKGEQCSLQIVGVCNSNPATTILAHLPDETHGMAKKSDDLSAAFCCSACHDVIDRRRFNEHFEQEAEFYLWRANKRTWRRLFELGILSIRGMK